MYKYLHNLFSNNETFKRRNYVRQKYLQLHYVNGRIDYGNVIYFKFSDLVATNAAALALLFKLYSTLSLRTMYFRYISSLTMYLIIQLYK